MRQAMGREIQFTHTKADGWITKQKYITNEIEKGRKAYGERRRAMGLREGTTTSVCGKGARISGGSKIKGGDLR